MTIQQLQFTRISVFATWNPSDRDTNVFSLSGGNDVATFLPTVSDTQGSIRGTVSKSSGKWFWEVTITTKDSAAELGVGIADSSATIGSFLGFDAHGWQYDSAGLKRNAGGSGVVYGGAYTTGDVIGVALDMDGGSITFYLNGVSQGVAFTGLTGSMYPAVGATTSAIASSVFTANFGATPFAFTPPSGYQIL